LHGTNHDRDCGTTQGLGIEDLVLVPLAFVASLARRLFRAAFSILIHALDYAFPIFLQLARFPLFTARIIGDGVALLLRAAIALVPVSGAMREEWRLAVSRRWSWLRQKISYGAFEEALHHAFENGMAWVFIKCRTLTPRGALLVIGCAILWLPISFGISTLMHVLLIAHAMSLPAWMQFLHPLATIIAKSKLLVLPVYPAAWPQAKQHPFVEGLSRYYRYVASRPLVQKAGARYRQTEQVLTQTAGTLAQAAGWVGLRHFATFLSASLTRLAAQVAASSRAAMMRLFEGSSRIPLIGPIVTSYAKHYDGAQDPNAEPFSQKVSDFFARWSIKFSAEYYDQGR